MIQKVERLIPEGWGITQFNQVMADAHDFVRSSLAYELVIRSMQMELDRVDKAQRSLRPIEKKADLEKMVRLLERKALLESMLEDEFFGIYSTIESERKKLVDEINAEEAKSSRV